MKDYTADFVEIMDVTYTTPAQPQSESDGHDSGKIVDLVIPRNYGLVRHRGQ